MSHTISVCLCVSHRGQRQKAAGVCSFACSHSLNHLLTGHCSSALSVGVCGDGGRVMGWCA